MKRVLKEIKEKVIEMNRLRKEIMELIPKEIDEVTNKNYKLRNGNMKGSLSKNGNELNNWIDNLVECFDAIEILKEIGEV
jgi:siroheme synthase (precorrin-2 oxidase/ferrochelatase)